MKKIQREVKTYKDIYVSVDGKEFTNEADCKAWESSYKGTLEASWKNVKKIEANSCLLGIAYSSDDHECYIIKPKNLDEITLINAYIQSSTDVVSPVLIADHIGKTIALDFGYDHYYCDVIILSDHIKEISDYIAKLENNMEEQDNDTEGKGN